MSKKNVVWRAFTSGIKCITDGCFAARYLWANTMRLLGALWHALLPAILAVKRSKQPLHTINLRAHKLAHHDHWDRDDDRHEELLVLHVSKENTAQSTVDKE